MRRTLFPFFLIAPVTANAGYISYESLDAGTFELGVALSRAEVEGTYRMPADTLDVSGTGTQVDLQLVAGIAPGINIAVAVSPIGEQTIETSTGDITGTAETEGMDDTRAQVRFRLADGASYPVLALGATLPTGDDEAPVPEVRSGTGVLQEGRSGGRGDGTTDYFVGYGYYIGSGVEKAFLGAAYTARGEADGVDYGDDLQLLAQGSFPLGPRGSLVGGLGVSWEGDTVDDLGRDETDASLSLEFGGMYALSPDTEIIATVSALSGGDTDHYDNAGTRYATSTVDSALAYAIRVKSASSRRADARTGGGNARLPGRPDRRYAESFPRSVTG